jgi:hypothetical protein
MRVKVDCALWSCSVVIASGGVNDGKLVPWDAASGVRRGSEANESGAPAFAALGNERRVVGKSGGDIVTYQRSNGRGREEERRRACEYNHRSLIWQCTGTRWRRRPTTGLLPCGMRPRSCGLLCYVRAYELAGLSPRITGWSFLRRATGNCASTRLLTTTLALRRWVRSTETTFILCQLSGRSLLCGRPVTTSSALPGCQPVKLSHVRL